MDRTATEEYIFGSILLLSNKMQVWGDAILSDLTLKQWFLLILISNMKNKRVFRVSCGNLKKELE
jgi:hypothetical protein